MATLAQAHEVILIVGAAFADGKDVVNLFDCDVLAILQAALTERVLVNVSISDPFPCAAVGAVHIGVALVLIVLLPGLLPMHFTILLVGQVRAAGVGAGAFGFHWHGSVLLSFSAQEFSDLEPNDVPDLLCVGYFSI